MSNTQIEFAPSNSDASPDPSIGYVPRPILHELAWCCHSAHFSGGPILLLSQQLGAGFSTQGAARVTLTVSYQPLLAPSMVGTS